MARNRFDAKFGAITVDLPSEPAVYLFSDELGVIYVGKAKNLKRRLSSYRNASRRKAHRKMRRIVREATALEVRLQPDELSALLLENKLIQELRPRHNIDGAYSFLYPAIGIGIEKQTLILCLTTNILQWASYSITWFGVFRSRRRSKAAFSALNDLLVMALHAVNPSTVGEFPRARGDWLVGFRRGTSLKPALESYLGGQSLNALEDIATLLLEKRRARLESARVQNNIDILRYFFEQDLSPLGIALKETGESFIAQPDRDRLFLLRRESRLRDS